MKKSELKKILKPLITECIKEVMFEDGVLSGIITEVARGMSTSAPSAAPPPPAAPKDPTLERMQRNAFISPGGNKLREQKEKLMSAIGADAYNGVNLFEGTTPAPAQGSLQQQATPLSGLEAGDAGVDISGIFSGAQRNWGAHMTNLKEGK
mgnify:CR=1 FL=1